MSGGGPEAGGDPGNGEARYAGDLEALRSSLAAVVERLDELALEVLRDALEEGHDTRPQLERRLTRARNGIERASRLLDGPDGPDGATGP